MGWRKTEGGLSMPYKDPAKAAAAKRRYYEKNRDVILEKNKERVRITDTLITSMYNRNYYTKHREELLLKMRTRNRKKLEPQQKGRKFKSIQQEKLPKETIEMNRKMLLERYGVIKRNQTQITKR